MSIFGWGGHRPAELLKLDKVSLTTRVLSAVRAGSQVRTSSDTVIYTDQFELRAIPKLGGPSRRLAESVSCNCVDIETDGAHAYFYVQDNSNQHRMARAALTGGPVELLTPMPLNQMVGTQDVFDHPAIELAGDHVYWLHSIFQEIRRGPHRRAQRTGGGLCRPHRPRLCLRHRRQLPLLPSKRTTGADRRPTVNDGVDRLRQTVTAPPPMASYEA